MTETGNKIQATYSNWEKKIRIFVSLIGYYFMFVWRKLQNISNFTMSKNASFSLFLTTQIFHVINAFSVLANGKTDDKMIKRRKKRRTHKWKRRINKSERIHIVTKLHPRPLLDFAIYQNIRGGKCACLWSVFTFAGTAHIYTWFLNLRNATFFMFLLLYMYVVFVLLNFSLLIWSKIDGVFDLLLFVHWFSFILFVLIMWHWRQVIHAVFRTNIVKYMVNNTKKCRKHPIKLIFAHNIFIIDCQVNVLLTFFSLSQFSVLRPYDRSMIENK